MFEVSLSLEPINVEAARGKTSAAAALGCFDDRVRLTVSENARNLQFDQSDLKDVHL